MNNLPAEVPFFDGYLKKYLDMQERIRMLFGVSNIDEFLCMDDSELVSCFMTIQQLLFLPSTGKKSNNLPLSENRSDSDQTISVATNYANSDKKIVESSQQAQEELEAKLKTDKHFVSDPTQMGFALTIAVRQNDAYAFAPTNENEPSVLHYAMIRTRISSFFRKFAQKIDNTGELLKFYGKGSLYFNEWDMTDVDDIGAFASEKCSMAISIAQIEQLALDNVYNNIEMLYDLWRLPTETVIEPISETEAKRRKTIRAKKEAEAKADDKSAKPSTEEFNSENCQPENSPIDLSETGKKQIIKFKPCISYSDFNKTISIMLQLLPLTSDRNTVKRQETYDSEKNRIREIFKKYQAETDTSFPPTVCIEGAVNNMLFSPYEAPETAENSRKGQQKIKNLYEAIQFLDKFPCAKKDLQVYLDRWNTDSLNILVGGAIEFSNDLYHRLDFEQNQILSDLRNRHPKRSFTIGDNVDPLELEKTAISMIDNRCVYSDLIGKYFGRAAGVVPGQRLSKGSIYTPHAITIAPVKKTRHRKKKQS